jgi:multicomponent K+:H+ antiporter subunit E
MKRWLPTPLLSAGLFALWMMLTRSLQSGQLLLGLALALIMPLWLRPLRPQSGPVRHPLIVMRLVLRVGGAVLISAIDVAFGVLRLHRPPPCGTFVTVPLDLRDEHALAALAMILAVIPGTVWSELAPDRSAVLVHVFDLDDEAVFSHQIKLLYEQPLREIFE